MLLSSAYPGPHLNEVGCDEDPDQETPDSGAVTEELDAETPAKKTRRTWPPLIRKWAVKYETFEARADVIQGRSRGACLACTMLV